MDQHQVNAALEALIAGDEGPWAEVVAGLRDGTIEHRTSQNQLVIKSTTPYGPVSVLGQYLQALRQQTDLSYEELATEIGISFSSVIRQMQGQVLGAWPSVRLMVDFMGGDVHEARRLWDAAKASRKR